MTNVERDERKAELEKEIQETRDLIKAMTIQLRPLIDELGAIRDEETLEVSDNWLDSKDSIDTILDKAWSGGQGNRVASSLVEGYVISIKPEGVAFWLPAGYYEVEDRDIRVMSPYIGLHKDTDRGQFGGIVEAINKICTTVGSTSEDYYLPIMTSDSMESYGLHPATNEVVWKDWGQDYIEFKGESLEDALSFIASHLPYDEAGLRSKE